MSKKTRNPNRRTFLKYAGGALALTAGGGGTAMNKAVDDIKVKNPNIVIVDYCILGMVSSTSTGQKPLRDKLEAQKWYLYQSGAGGSKVLDGTYLTPNHTDFVPKDANGKRWNTWFADYHFDQVWKHINKLDGTFTDNFFWKPAVNGDWNRDGRSDSQNDSTVGTWYRQGMISHTNRVKTRTGKLVTGNFGRSGQPGGGEYGVPGSIERRDTPSASSARPGRPKIKAGKTMMGPLPQGHGPPCRSSST